LFQKDLDEFFSKGSGSTGDKDISPVKQCLQLPSVNKDTIDFLYIQISYLLGVFLDELAAGFK
jgi:hypothetical protein